MYFITGLMACGKPTVSDLLTKSLKNAPIFVEMYSRKMIVSGREDMPDSLSEKPFASYIFVTKLIADAAKSYFEDGFFGGYSR